MKPAPMRWVRGTKLGGEGGGKRVAPSSSWGDDFGCIAGVTQLVECNLAKVVMYRDLYQFYCTKKRFFFH